MDAVLDALSPTWSGLVLAWARVLPTVLIVPAFGLLLLPWSVRVAFGLMLVAGVAPAVEPVTGAPVALSLLKEMLSGLPVALTAAAALWAAQMAGGILDELRFGEAVMRADGESPLSRLCVLFAIAAFFETGGPARIVAALVRPAEGPALARAALDVAAGIGVAVAVAGPVLIVSIVVHVTSGVILRVVPGLGSFVPSLRALLVLCTAALVFERIAELIVITQTGG